MIIKPSIVALIAISMLACSSSDKKPTDPLLEEAARYHQQATEVQAQVEPKIDGIDSLKTVFEKGNRPNRQAIVATLDSLKEAFEAWEENLVEVPGMPHTHSHGKGEHGHHHHQDATMKDLPPQQMRDLQRETLNNIQQIQARLNKTLQSVQR